MAQVRVAPQPRVPRLVQHGSLRQPVIGAGRLRLFGHPLSQVLQDPHQTLMGDVTHRVGEQRRAHGWHQEGTAGAAEGLHHGLDLLERGLHPSGELIQLRRQGGDEFIILLDSLNDSDVSRDVVDKVMDTVRQNCVIGDHSLSVGISVGVSCYPADGTTPDQSIKNADTAMYYAKECGRNNARFF
ncbi:MAG: GGDEF domain-containing protein [Gammaproteobacteria bacterium]|nr:GGDEF domain-containing protein [Gammaproteobacteria bacterium]